MTGILVPLWMLAFSLPPANATVLSSGIHGMTWGVHADSYPRLEKVREAGDVSYYADREMVYHAVGQLVAAVIYGFFRDQLFAAYIKLNYPNQAYYLEKHFSTEYGSVKVTSDSAIRNTIANQRVRQSMPGRSDVRALSLLGAAGVRGEVLLIHLPDHLLTWRRHGLPPWFGVNQTWEGSLRDQDSDIRLLNSVRRESCREAVLSKRRISGKSELFKSVEAR